MSTDTKLSWYRIEKDSLADKIMSAIEFRFDFEEFVKGTVKASVTPQPGIDERPTQAKQVSQKITPLQPGGKVTCCFGKHRQKLI